MNGSKLTPKSRKNIRVIKLFLISMIFVMIAAFIAIIGCNYIVNRDFIETFYNVGSIKVNDKIRVIQISDLHGCAFGNDNSKIVDRVEKLKPDIIIYTGDGVDSGSDTDDRTISLCDALADIAPSYYIYGNNEVEKFYDCIMTQDALDEKFGFDNSNRDPKKLLEISDPFAEKLEAVGVRVLKNSSDTVTVGSTKIDIFGVLTSNPSSFWSYAGEGFGEYMYTNETNLKIMAVHEPLVFEEYTPDYWGDLMLSGHTHGGTVKVPLLGPLYTHDGGLFPARKGHYVYGRYEVQGAHLIVSSGLENNNFFRINNEPEIVIVDINKF